MSVAARIVTKLRELDDVAREAAQPGRVIAVNTGGTGFTFVDTVTQATVDAAVAGKANSQAPVISGGMTVFGTAAVDRVEVLTSLHVNTLSANTYLDLRTAAFYNVGTTNNTIPIIGAGDKLPASVIPSVAATLHTATSDVAMTALSALAGDIVNRTDINAQAYFIKVDGGNNRWRYLPNYPVVGSVNSIAPGYNGQVTITTANVAENTNLYFTDARARGAISAGTGLTYSSSTGVIAGVAASGTVAGLMSAAHFTLVDGATSSPTANALVRRSATGSIQATGFVGDTVSVTSISGESCVLDWMDISSTLTLTPGASVAGLLSSHISDATHNPDANTCVRRDSNGEINLGVAGLTKIAADPDLSFGGITVGSGPYYYNLNDMAGTTHHAQDLFWRNNISTDTPVTIIANRQDWDITLTPRTGPATQLEVARVAIPGDILTEGTAVVIMLTSQTSGGVGAQSGTWATIIGIEHLSGTVVAKTDSTGSFLTIGGGDAGYVDYIDMYIVRRTSAAQVFVSNLRGNMRASLNTYNGNGVAFFLRLSIGSNATTPLTFTPNTAHVTLYRKKS
jgi:hypothetical protein